MPFKNRVRIPIELTRPQYVEEFNKYRLANGTSKTQSVIIRKVYQGNTDWLSEALHEKIKIALAHDTVYIEGEKYAGVVTQEGSYDIKWLEKSPYPTAPAEFKAEVSGFDATNSNCETCEEAIQVACVDDDLGSINEGGTSIFDVSENDSICCYPVEFSIRYYNADVVDSAIISNAGVTTITLKTPLQSYNNLKIASYRAQCGSGQYDDADIYTDIVGSLISCFAPVELGAFFLTNMGVTLLWTPGQPYYSGSYHYQLYDLANLGIIVHEGDTTDPSIIFNDLEPSSDYIFYVKSVCSLEVESNYIEVSFTTLATDMSGPGTGNPNCGRYKVEYNWPGGPGIQTITYTKCDGTEGNLSFVNGIPVYICALQHSPGSFVLINTSLPTTTYLDINYIEQC